MIAILDSFFPLVDEHRKTILSLHQKYPEEKICIFVSRQKNVPSKFDMLNATFSDLEYVTFFPEEELISHDITLLYETGLSEHRGPLPSCPVRPLRRLSEEIRKVKDGSTWHTSYPMMSFFAQNKLFYCRKVSEFLSKERYLHSASVAETAYQIALAQKLDARKAFLAGMLHDVGKDFDKKKQRLMVRKRFPAYGDYPDFSLHQFVSRILAEEEFHITDKSILSSIEWHCTGKGRMTPFEMVIYVADKCEPRRDFPTASIFETAKRDIPLSFRMVLQEQIEYLKRKGIDYHTNASSVEMFRHYLKEDKICH